METVFSYEFRSPILLWYIFLGLFFVGFVLGLLFFIGFRRRFPSYGREAGWTVLVVATLMGCSAGFIAAQPDYFNHLIADRGSLTLTYHLPRQQVQLEWTDIEDVRIERNRVAVICHDGSVYASPVVYRGARDDLIQSIRTVMPETASR